MYSSVCTLFLLLCIEILLKFNCRCSCISQISVILNLFTRSVLEAASQLGGEGLTPFYELLEGGKGGELMMELEDYFYYALLRSQDVDTVESRETSTKIPLSQVPFIMRALGYYPTEQEVEDMINEVKFSEYVENGKYVEDIDLGGLIRRKY